MTTIRDAVSSGFNNIKNYVKAGLTDANNNKIDQINNSSTSNPDSTQRDILGRPIKQEVNGGRALTELNSRDLVPKPSSRVTQIANSLSQFTTGNQTNFATMMPGISNPTSNSDFNSNPQVSRAAPASAPPMIINNVSAVASANNAGSSSPLVFNNPAPVIASISNSSPVDASIQNSIMNKTPVLQGNEAADISTQNLS